MNPLTHSSGACTGQPFPGRAMSAAERLRIPHVSDTYGESAETQFAAQHADLSALRPVPESHRPRGRHDLGLSNPHLVLGMGTGAGARAPSGVARRDEKAA